MANDRAADVFAASQGETHDGESGRRMGYPGAFPGEARSLSGEGPQPREHAATSTRQQARQLPAHSRQVSQPALRIEPLTSITRLRTPARSGLIVRHNHAGVHTHVAHVRFHVTAYHGA